MHEEGGGGDEASIISVISMHVSLCVSSLGSYLSVGYSSKPSRYSLPHSL